MLPKYHKYMQRNNRRSLLTRFCGMYSVKLDEYDPETGERTNEDEDPKEHIFLVMNSVFPSEASMFVSERFDLKGSTVGRECSEEEKTSKGSLAVLKDLDLAREVQVVRSFENPRSREPPEFGLNIGPTAKAALLSQLRRDVKLLQECKVMDYSLLVGVVDMDTETGDVDGPGESKAKVDARSFHRLVRSRLEEIKMRDAQRITAQRDQSRKGRGLQEQTRRLRRSILRALSAPVLTLIAPIAFIGQKSYTSMESVLSSILTIPLPYYGAGLTGIDGGPLSVMEGRRNGNRAVYYFGLIDFLQPWTFRKVMERRVKGVLGYDVHAISSVDPEEYAARFLEFLEAHIT